MWMPAASSNVGIFRMKLCQEYCLVGNARNFKTLVLCAFWNLYGLICYIVNIFRLRPMCCIGYHLSTQIWISIALAHGYLDFKYKTATNSWVVIKCGTFFTGFIDFSTNDKWHFVYVVADRKFSGVKGSELAQKRVFRWISNFQNHETSIFHI